jgi:GTPase SAR1 family protein
VYKYGIQRVKKDIDQLQKGKAIIYLQVFDNKQTKRYYRGAVGALIVYDITKRDSFNNVSRWLNELQINESHPDSLVMVIGNKSDLNEQRQVTQNEATLYAENNHLMFMETSALNSTNVEKAFELLIHTIFDKLSSKLTTMDDKKAEIMRGKSIDLSPPTKDSQKSSTSCAC